MSESSLKRWADDGIVRVTKTAGGHRRITIGEAIRFVRAIRAPLIRPDLLGLSDLSRAEVDALSADSPADRLRQFLLDGRARETRGLLLSLYLQGRSVAEIGDGPVRQAMDELGELWKHDPAGIYLEHRATSICIQAVQRLHLLIDAPDSGEAAVGGGIARDPYLLAPMLATTALAAEGWHAVNLGPDTPFETLLLAAERHEARLMWLSVSSVQDAAATQQELDALVHAARQRNLALVVGGRALDRVVLAAGDGVHCGKTLSELVSIATALRGPTPADGQ